MQVCPRCGYVDAVCWRQPYSKGMEYQYAMFEDLAEYEPVIHALILAAPLRKKNPIKEITTETYAYGLWRSGYVRRRYIEVWKVQKWRSIPMEKHKPKVDTERSLLEFIMKERDI